VDRARIAALPFFVGLPEQELDAVAAAAGEVEFAAGESLTAEGQFGHGGEVWALEHKAPEAARRLRAALDARQDESS